MDLTGDSLGNDQQCCCVRGDGAPPLKLCALSARLETFGYVAFFFLRVACAQWCAKSNGSCCPADAHAACAGTERACS